MSTTIQATINDADLPIIQHLFKRLNIKTIVLKDDKSDSPLNSYSDKVAKKIKMAREEKEKGELTTISSQMLWEK
ncbi:hypothetical protein ACI76O_11805 [Capnocytophaga cynodegmi]|uniref:hypothetical protein n=1 Tax=Capnocytophaga cynodegmi TaxID=28189 RepID=UPI00385E0DA0